MRIGILGTGGVGQTIATALVERGHAVRLGSRTATNEKAGAWVLKAGGQGSQGTFADAAAFGEMVFNCTAGTASLEALEAAGAQNLEGKRSSTSPIRSISLAACRPPSRSATPTHWPSRSSGRFRERGW